MTDVINAADALKQLSQTLVQTHVGKTGLMVCDPDTMNAAGAQVNVKLESELSLKVMMLDETPKANLSLAIKVKEEAEGCQFILSVGSGTITDLCKYASYHTGKEHISVATAASMNGYASATASLIDKGVKQSYNVKAPDILCCDTSVIVQAPARLTAAGIGDTLCRATIENDLRIAAFFSDTSDTLTLLKPIQEYEKRLLASSPTIAIPTLMDALIASGQAMTMAGSSAPASQSEHLIAHALDALYPDSCAHLLHGEMIAVTTLAAYEVQEKLFNCRELKLKPQVPYEQMAEVFGAEIAPTLYTEYETKYHKIDSMLVSGTLGATCFKQPHSHGAAKLREILKGYGCPVTAEDIGITGTQMARALQFAHCMRGRITALDFAA